VIDNIKDSIKAKLYDFAYTPFMSSFIISWIILNHKYLLIYFGDEKLADKIKLLDEYIFKTMPLVGYDWWTYQFWYPLAIALFYVFIYPWFALKFYNATLGYNKKSMTIKQRIEDETPITQERARELKREHYKLADDRDQALDRLKEREKEHNVILQDALKPLQNEIEAHITAHNVSNKLIDALKIENESLKKSLETLPAITAERDELKERTKNLKYRLINAASPAKITFVQPSDIELPQEVIQTEDDRTKILRFFYESNYKTKMESYALDNIVEKTKIPRPKAQILLNEMIESKLLSRSQDVNRNISITQLGNETLIKMFDHE